MRLSIIDTQSQLREHYDVAEDYSAYTYAAASLASVLSAVSYLLWVLS